MSLTIRRTGKDDYSRHIKALIVGSPGAGKTLTSSTWKNPLIASAEGGLMSIADRNVPYVEVKATQDLLQLKILMDQEPEVREKYLGFPVDTIVIDTIDEVQKLFIRERLEEGKKEAMELRDWGWLGEQMRAMIRGFRNLDMNVVLTCHMKESSDSESGRLYFVPGLQGAIGDEIPAFVDLALLLKTASTSVVEDGVNKRVMVRYLQTYPDSQHSWIKDRSGKLPQELDVNFTDDYQRIYDLIYGSMNLPDHQPVAVGPVKERTDVEDEPENVLSDKVIEPPKKNGQKEDKFEMVVEDGTVKESTTVKEKAKAALKVQAPPAKVDIICEECGGKVESDNQADISRIRFRKVLCRACFIGAKSSK